MVFRSDDPRPASSQAGQGRRSPFQLGIAQMLITVAVILVLNLVARRLHLGLWGVVAMCAAIAFCWTYIAAKRRSGRRG